MFCFYLLCVYFLPFFVCLDPPFLFPSTTFIPIFFPSYLFPILTFSTFPPFLLHYLPRSLKAFLNLPSCLFLWNLISHIPSTVPIWNSPLAKYASNVLTFSYSTHFIQDALGVNICELHVDKYAFGIYQGPQLLMCHCSFLSVVSLAFESVVDLSTIMDT